MRLKTMFGLWLPLAISFELMMLEGPAIQTAIGRLGNTPLNLAAFGLNMSLSLLIESPVIMLLATAIALVRGPNSYRALRRFMLTLAVFCTVLSGFVSYTPLFDVITSRIMHVPPPIAAAARSTIRLMLFWSAAIAWRRFYQGILIQYGETRKVSAGTLLRLVASITTAFVLVRWGHLPGAQVGACILMVAVVAEAIATTFFALPIVRRDIFMRPTPNDTPLSQRQILRFHAPLAATTVLALLAMPMTEAALARLDAPKATLAAGPVVFMILLVMRGWGLALQEITVAHAGNAAARSALLRLSWLVGIVTSCATAIFVFSPLLGIYLGKLLHLPLALQHLVRQGVTIGLLMPLITSLGSWARGYLVAQGKPEVVFLGLGINLSTHVTLLVIGVMLRMPGILVSTTAFFLAAMVEFGYMVYRVRSLHPRPDDAQETEVFVPRETMEDLV